MIETAGLLVLGQSDFVANQVRTAMCRVHRPSRLRKGSANALRRLRVAAPGVATSFTMLFAFVSL